MYDAENVEFNFSRLRRHLKQQAYIRADQNLGGALLESPIRTAMHGKSRVSSVISVELN